MATHGGRDRRYVVSTDKNILQAERALREALERWGVTEYDIQRGKDGGATVSFYPRGATKVVTLTSTDQPEPRLNMAKLWRGIEGMMLAERQGFATLQASYYEQTTALVEHESTRSNRYAPYQVLGLQPDADREQVDAMVRHLSAKAHKNGGGEPELRRINEIGRASCRERVCL